MGADADQLTVARVVERCRSLPEPRRHEMFRHEHIVATRRAATLLPVIEIDGVAGVVMTKRADALDHGGDWVFPGGGVDNDDASHSDAARREAAEELGVDVDAIEVIGQLTTWGPIVTGYVIETYVGVLPPGTTFLPDEYEVAEVLVMPIADFMNADRHERGPARVNRFRRGDDVRALKSPLLDLRHYRIRDDEYLWGLQADILHELLHHLTDGRHDF